MVVKWSFTDPGGNNPTTYTWEVNPNDGGLPAYKKNYQYVSTCAPDGKVIVFEGRQEAKRGQFSGVSLSETQHLAFIEWFEKRNQIQITDDLNRTMTVIIESYSPTRRWTVSHPYKHDYTIDYVVVDWS